MNPKICQPIVTCVAMDTSPINLRATVTTIFGRSDMDDGGHRKKRWTAASSVTGAVVDVDLVRRGRDAPVDDPAHGDRDERENSGDDRPLDRGRAAGAVGLVAQTVNAHLDARPYVGHQGVVHRILPLHDAPL